MIISYWWIVPYVVAVAAVSGGISWLINRHVERGRKEWNR